MAALQGVSPYNARQYQQQNQRRGLNSPGAVGPVGGNPAAAAAAAVALQRQNSFQGQGAGGGATTPDGFGGPQSPYGGSNVNVFQQQQLQRLQRQGSVPQATQHLPGEDPAQLEGVLS